MSMLDLRPRTTIKVVLVWRCPSPLSRMVAWPVGRVVCALLRRFQKNEYIKGGVLDEGLHVGVGLDHLNAAAAVEDALRETAGVLDQRLERAVDLVGLDHLDTERQEWGP
jgi:hypothetical protein